MSIASLHRSWFIYTSSKPCRSGWTAQHLKFVKQFTVTRFSHNINNGSLGRARNGWTAQPHKSAKHSNTGRSFKIANGECGPCDWFALAIPTQLIDGPHNTHRMQFSIRSRFGYPTQATDSNNCNLKCEHSHVSGYGPTAGTHMAIRCQGLAHSRMERLASKL